jgi:hypothetical protein
LSRWLAKGPEGQATTAEPAPAAADRPIKARLF